MTKSISNYLLDGTVAIGGQPGQQVRVGVRVCRDLRPQTRLGLGDLS